MRVALHPKAIGKIRRGHPWVYREAVRDMPRNLEMGQIVDLTGDDAFIARGIYDAQNPIAIRVYSHDPAAALDTAWFTGAFERCFALRDTAFDAKTTAYRLVNGEGDRLPGIVIDRYADVAVMRLDGLAIESYRDTLVAALEPLLRARGVNHLLQRFPKRKTAPLNDTLFGTAPRKAIEVLEHGTKMMVDVGRGQKTGAFLDQRENRARVRRWTRPGDRVLNLFSYTGGFSIAAALAGASKVTSIDIAHDAHGTAHETFHANGIEPRGHYFITADAIDFAGVRAIEGDRYEIVISDPPSFARNEKSVDRALASYSKLHAACAAVVEKGGLFLAASCSSHVSMEAFMQTLDDRSLGTDEFVLREAFGLPVDHPTLPSFPEGRYLKMAVLSRTRR